MVALDGGRPQVMNLRDLLTLFVAFREQVVTRRTKFLAQTRPATAPTSWSVSPLRFANSDEIIRVIRTSPDPNTARGNADVARLAGEGCRSHESR